MKTRYNERSWGIDLISAINVYCSKTRRRIGGATGELTLIQEEQEELRLFPDVLLLESPSSDAILQGWELKMPDTPITDADFFKKAKRKAQILGLSSFVLWNANTAQLFVASKSGDYTPEKTWSVPTIHRREDVAPRRGDWIAVLDLILTDLNDLFESGKILGRRFVLDFSGTTLLDAVTENANGVAAELRIAARRDGRLGAEVDLWWRGVRGEYPREENQWDVLARCNLISWVNKVFFAHVLKSHFSSAGAIQRIGAGSTPQEAIQVFNAISRGCDFWSLFQEALGEALLTKRAWAQISQISTLLSALHLDSIDQVLLGKFLEETVQESRLRSAGQYATPPPVADLLVRIALLNKESDFFDPFCGTGGIVRAAYDLKVAHGVKESDAIGAVWASDKFSYPLQIATMALSRPKNMGIVLNLFRKDVVELRPGMEIRFGDPNDGHTITKRLPTFPCLASNLPFVRQEDLAVSNPRIAEINAWVRKHSPTSDSLDGRSDLLAYLPFYMWRMLSPEGRLGVIVCNAWLGTKWGQVFRRLLSQFFHIEQVIASGSGRWFQTADVVTNMLILNRRRVPSLPREDEETSFHVLQTPLGSAPPDIVASMASAILRQENTPQVSTRRYTGSEILEIERLGLGWSALFADVNWLPAVKDRLIPASTIFDINRGERRGWDEMFYPQPSHGIEPQYLRPVLLNTQSVVTLEAQPDSAAFCCGRSLEELKALGHRGALNWIKRFQGRTNETGLPLTEALKRANLHWYQMSDSTLADLVASINYGDRLFIARLRRRSFVNQRLIRFTQRGSGGDTGLCHALLNSVVGLWFLEALGFGRGLAALDLNATNLRSSLYMLNPALLSAEQRARVKNAFHPLLTRRALPLLKELEDPDRLAFESVVWAFYGISEHGPRIIDSLKTIYSIRFAVKPPRNGKS